ncbi:MAG: hypothetical protein ACI9IQ_002313, partial [Cyclobacteriaceae bacterium]
LEHRSFLLPLNNCNYFENLNRGQLQLNNLKPTGDSSNSIN